MLPALREVTPESDIDRHDQHVRLVPQADISTMLLWRRARSRPTMAARVRTLQRAQSGPSAAG
jgi:hypothetical protein